MLSATQRQKMKEEQTQSTIRSDWNTGDCLRVRRSRFFFFPKLRIVSAGLYSSFLVGPIVRWRPLPTVSGKK